MENKVRVLIVDDSLVARNLLCRIFGTDPRIEIIATANEGTEALNFLKQRKPDVITMDINMPGMDGFEVTARIMEEYAIPIVIVSGNYESSETAKTFAALEAGAVAILPKPKGPGSDDFERSVRKFCSTIKSMAEVRVVRRSRASNCTRDQLTIPGLSCSSTYDPLPHQPIHLIAIGASAGGPDALVRCLSILQGRLTVPVLLVQHIDAGFVDGFSTWLTEHTGIPSSVAGNGDPLIAGRLYMAPGNHNLSVSKDKLIHISKDPPEKGLRPSVSYLFRSVRQVFGQTALGVILSGMGKDGAEELKLMRDSGSITIVQDEQSSLVFGMPGEAFRISAACHILPPGKIADAILQYIKK